MANPLETIKQTALNAAFNFKIIPLDDGGNIITGNALQSLKNIANVFGKKPVILQYNPQSFSIKEELKFEEQQTQGQTGGDPQYKGIKPRDFSVEFTIDSSGLFTPLQIPVNAHIALFRSLTTIPDTSDHRPKRLIVQYGTFISQCNLMSSEVTYSLFDRQGFPLRAKVKANFAETKDSELNKAARFFSSPDVTHEYIVEQEDELLPFITHRYYKTPDYYIQVASVNKMKHFRALAQQQQIFFPPISQQ